MKGMRSRLICCWWNIKHYSWSCSCARTEHEESCLQALLQGFTLYTLHLQYKVAVFQMRGLTILCTVNTVPHTFKLLTVELVCSQILLTCICAELGVDCLGEETPFIKRLRNCYSITNKDIINTVMHLGRGCRIYLFIYCCQYIPVCVYCIFFCLFFVLFSSNAIHLL